MSLSTIRPFQGTGFKSLAEGDQVAFDIEQGPKGSKAVNVVQAVINRKGPSDEGALSEENMNSRKNAARREREQQKLDVQSVAERFPEVANIVINMTYNQRGIQSILRTLHYFPDNYAFFIFYCLSKDFV